MDKNNLEKILKFLLVILVVSIVIYLYIKEDNTENPIPASKLSKQEQLELKIEGLEDDIEKYRDQISTLNSELDELKRDYEYDEDLISILRNQLLRHGIEPEEL